MANAQHPSATWPTKELLVRIENEITRHKQAHEAHLHWAIILFAATVALIARIGITPALWEIPVCGLVLNTALWFRAARAYRSLDSHWYARDQLYTRLSALPSSGSDSMRLTDLDPFLDTTMYDKKWRNGMVKTVWSVGVPEFFFLDLGYTWFLYDTVKCAREKTLSALSILGIFGFTLVFLIVTGLLRIGFRPSVKYR